LLRRRHTYGTLRRDRNGYVAELLWDGKYRDKTRVAPVRIELPFQTVETVNESARDRARTLELFASGGSTQWRNRLIWGDKKYVLPSLRAEFPAKVDLIYIDPPFDTGADFSITAEIPETDQALAKQPSIMEMKAYRDTWGVSSEERARGVTHKDKFLRWFSDTAFLLRDLLADTGLLFVHLDDNVGHEAKVVLDEVFGADRFRGEIIWGLGTGAKSRKFFSIQHNLILVYSGGETWTFNHEAKSAREPFAAGSLATHFRQVDQDGRRYRDRTVNGKTYRYYEDEGRLIGSVWTDISSMTANSPIIDEATGYPTQKPEKLLDRIIEVCSQKDQLVLDCFCGSGTAAVVAEKLGRRWIACDLSRFAIHTTRKRLLALPGVRPFVVQNLGKYERSAWASAEFTADHEVRESAYRGFILRLFHAEPLSGHSWLHGAKAGRYVHVGAVDAPVTAADVKGIAREVLRAGGGAVDVLGWEFAFELNETAKQIAAEANVHVQFRRIPREILDKRAVDQGDIQEKDFFELRVFSTKTTQDKRSLAVTLADFMMPAEDLPEDVKASVTHWSQWVDYWAIDWDFREDTFHNQWQSYRTRDNRKLELSAKHEYKEPGDVVVMVKVIDLLGCDTTTLIRVKVE
jgi:16S rRNA G966 N2-methylase RsmD